MPVASTWKAEAGVSCKYEASLVWVPSHPDLQSKTPPEKYAAQLGEFLRSVYEDLDTVPPLNKLGMATFYRVCMHRLLKHYLLYLVHSVSEEGVGFLELELQAVVGHPL